MTSHCSVKTTEGIFGFALHLLHSTHHAEAMKGRDWKLIFLAKPLTSHSCFPVIKFHLSSLKAEIKGANSWIIFIPGHIKFVKAKKKKFSVALSSSLELSSDRTRGAGLPSLGLFWSFCACTEPWDAKTPGKQSSDLHWQRGFWYTPPNGAALPS